MFDTLKREFRYGLRGLFAAPGFLLVALLTLALGIGSVCAVYSVVDGVLLRPLPYPDAERIVTIRRVQHPYGGPVSKPVFEDWQQGTEGLFDAMSAMMGATVNLTGQGEAERLGAYRVSPGFWDVMGLPAQLGRYFGDEEERTGARTVVLSDRFWQRRFGGDPGVIGKDLLLNGQSWTVVGVAPAGLQYPGSTDLFMPAGLPAAAADRGSNSWFVMGRLAQGADAAQASAALESINGHLAATYPDAHEGLGARITPLLEATVGDVRQPLLVLLGASALVLAIACANLANLLLARGSRRQRELAVRSALGAGRGRLLRTVLIEAVLLAVSGGAIGIALAAVAIPALLASAPGILPWQGSLGVDAGVALVTLGVSVVVVVAFALLPALRAATTAPAGAMKEEGRGGAGGQRRSRARSVLVISEIALSLTLLVGAGLLIESLREIGRTDTGIDTANVLTATVTLPAIPDLSGGDDFEAAYARHTNAIAGPLDAIVERLSAIPGVLHVGVSDALPMSGMDNVSSDVELIGRAAPEGGAAVGGANWRFVNPGFFDALGIRIVSGRALAATDTRVGAWPDAVLVNETFVRRYLGDGDAVGSQVSFLGGNKTIVGVVGDTRLMGYERDPLPEVYMTHGHAVQAEFQLALKTAGDPMRLAEPVRAALRALDPDMPVRHLRTMDDLAAEGIARRSFNLKLMTVFSAAALLLAAIGLYGVIAYTVAERRHEFGIRLSMGATSGKLLSLVLAQGMWLAGIGLCVGIAGALALGRALSSQLVGVGSGDPGVLGTVLALLAFVAFLACLVPALRASRVDPVVALRG
jgi:putative ABC transport system permease protein